MVRSAVAGGLLSASAEAAEADVHLIVVPTPFKGDHEPDISFVESATRAVLPRLKEGDAYVIESTSPVGTTEKMAALIFRERPELEGKLFIAYCPERVLPGNVLHELVHNDRVIGGIDDASTRKAMDFYRLFVEGELFGTNARTAEMCKLTENSSRDVQIAFANELSLICDRAGINVWELVRLANRHPRVNILQPGAGVGGHCIAVDPWFIVSDYPRESRLIGTAREINNYKAFWCAEKIRSAMLEFELKGRKCGMRFLDADVKKPLGAVSAIVDEGNTVVFSRKWGQLRAERRDGREYHVGEEGRNIRDGPGEHGVGEGEEAGQSEGDDDRGDGGGRRGQGEQGR